MMEMFIAMLFNKAVISHVATWNVAAGAEKPNF